MHRRTLLIAAGSIGLTACGEAIDQVALDDGAQVDVAVLDENLTALKTAFNAFPEKVRLLFVIGPSCGPCLRGLIEMSEALGSGLRASDHLDVLIVHVPTLGAQEHHARRAANLLHGSSVQHYWDPRGATGDAVQQSLGIPEYAWDVWLTYPPGPTWTDTAPPAPAAWSHQLGRLSPENRLNPEVFAADVRARVEQVA
ncbi:MAG: hypothetical protein R3C31_10350 [Hyphomonadaceae bacterium]